MPTPAPEPPWAQILACLERIAYNTSHGNLSCDEYVARVIYQQKE